MKLKCLESRKEGIPMVSVLAVILGVCFYKVDQLLPYLLFVSASVMIQTGYIIYLGHVFKTHFKTILDGLRKQSAVTTTEKELYVHLKSRFRFSTNTCNLIIEELTYRDDVEITTEEKDGFLLWFIPIVTKTRYFQMVE